MSVWDDLSALLQSIDTVMGFETTFERPRAAAGSLPVGRVPEILRLRVLELAKVVGVDTAKKRLEAPRKSDIGLGPGESLEALMRQMTAHGLEAVVPLRSERHEDSSRAYRGFANVLVGLVTEEDFKSRYEERLSASWVFADLGASNEEVDIELVERSGASVVRLNVKNASEQFGEAAKFVGVEPDDCVPLGIYKIFTALGLRAGESGIDRGELLTRKAPLVWVYLVDWGLSRRVQTLLQDELKPSAHSVLQWFFKVKIKYHRDLENILVKNLIAQLRPKLLALVQADDYHAISSRKVANLLFNGQWATRIPKLHVPRAQGRFGGEIGTHLSVQAELTPWEKLLAQLTGDQKARAAAVGAINAGKI